MIVSDRKKIVFMHIPKCGGTTVRRQLLPLDDTGGRFSLVREHPALGRLDYTHISLPLLKDYFPEEFGKVLRYQGFALCREPFARFRSSMAQRISQYVGAELTSLDAETQEKEVERAIGRLCEDRTITDPAFVHFTPQSDYVFADGERLIEHVYPLEAIGALYRHLERVTGLAFLPDLRLNQSVKYRNPKLQPLVRAAATWLRDRTPARAYARLQTLAKRVLVEDAASRKLDVLESDRVKSFVAEYYRDDFSLYESARKAQDNAAPAATDRG